MIRYRKVVGLPHTVEALTPVGPLSTALASTGIGADEVKSTSHLMIVAKRLHYEYLAFRSPPQLMSIFLLLLFHRSLSTETNLRATDFLKTV